MSPNNLLTFLSTLNMQELNVRLLLPNFYSTKSGIDKLKKRMNRFLPSMIPWNQLSTHTYQPTTPRFHLIQSVSTIFTISVIQYQRNEISEKNESAVKSCSSSHQRTALSSHLVLLTVWLKEKRGSWASFVSGPILTNGWIKVFKLRLG